MRSTAHHSVEILLILPEIDLSSYKYSIMVLQYRYSIWIKLRANAPGTPSKTTDADERHARSAG